MKCRYKECQDEAQPYSEGYCDKHFKELADAVFDILGRY